MSDFSSRVEAFLDEFFRLHPTVATTIGEHAHDDRWPDLSAAGRTDRLAFGDRWLAEFAAMDGLTADEAIDRDLLLGELEAARFDDTELREDAWNPLGWVYLLGDGLFSLNAREFAPLADRLASTAGRLEQMPAVLDAARDTLVGHAGGPVGRFQTETALKQFGGIEALVAEALAAGDAAASTDERVAAVLPRLSDGRGDGAVRPGRVRGPPARCRPAGESRRGPARTRAVRGQDAPHDALRDADPGTDPGRSGTGVRGGPGRDGPARARPVAGLAPGSGAVRPTTARWSAASSTPSPRSIPAADDLLDFCREENARIEAFCSERDLVGLADEPLEVQWTPVFLRSFGGAMLSSPGPLDRGQKAFFAITPMPDDWTDEQRESNLREDNDRMLRLLTIHEAVPGHYLQGVYANRCPSLVRAIFASGLFAEGWAVYVTQVMMDVGYGADDPALMLDHWKFYLRSVTNAIIDARIHCDGMTEDEAVALMVDGGFQEEAEARAKFDRARLSSTQLSTYFAGSMEMWDIEREVAGARRSSPVTRGVPPPCPSRGSSVGSGRRPGSSIGRTSNRCSPTGRRRRRSCAGSCSASVPAGTRGALTVGVAGLRSGLAVGRASGD